MNSAAVPPRILHLHSTFDPGGKEVRNVRLMNAWGKAAQHAIVCDDPARRGAAQLIDPAVKVSWPDFPTLSGKPWPGRLFKLAEAMRGYDLVCSYNWGAIGAVMAHSLLTQHFDLPPLVHHEDGFNEDEATRLKTRRNLFRQLALARSAALVVPSNVLEDIALNIWSQPRARVRRIANGIETTAFATRPANDAWAALAKPEGQYWVGSLAGLRKVKNLDMLVRAVRHLPDNWHLVIAGEGPERENLLAQARALGIEGRVHLPGFVQKPQQVAGLFDIFALSSHSEQFPISVVEAMAAARPVVATRVGDLGSMVASENWPFLVPSGDEQALADMLLKLAQDGSLRDRIGAANREKACSEYDKKGMENRYRALYWGLMGRNIPR